MYKTRLGKLITLGSKIAKGGEGEVFNIVGDYSNCIKIYHENIRTSEREEKLKFMTLNPPKDVIGINHKICWPKEVVYENGNFVGFLMPRSFDDSLLPYHLCQPLIPKKLISQWHNTFDRDTIKGRSSRIKLSVNIIATVNKIHISKKYVLVDLKPQNLLVTASGKVSIIDLDSLQISENGKVLFRAPVSTPEYTPPEASELIKKNLPITQDWDVFSLGVLVYEILCGIHPYVGSASPPHENLNTIQEKIKVNLTHITKGEAAFKILPPPHKNFLRYNIEIRNIFKKIFKPYIPSESSRPELKHFGETLFNSIVQLEELQKKEAKKVNKDFEKEALENYLKLKKDNKKLNERYKTVISKLNIHITDNKNLRTKLDKRSNNFSVLSNFILFFLLIAVSCTWIITYNISLDNYNELKEDYLLIKKNETDISSSNFKSLTLENKSNTQIWVSIGYVDCDLEYHYLNKRSKGWFFIDVGKKISLDLTSTLGDEKYFKCGKLWLYAENSEQNSRWFDENSNNNNFILHNNENFNYTEWVSPAKRSNIIRKENFLEIQLDEGDTYQSFSN